MNGSIKELEWSHVTIHRLAHFCILPTCISGLGNKIVFSWPVRTPDYVHKCFWRASLSTERGRIANCKGLKVSLILQSDDPKPRVTRHHIRSTIFTSTESFTQSSFNDTRHRIDLYSSFVQQNGWGIKMSGITMNRLARNNQVALLTEVFLTDSDYSSEWDKYKDQEWPMATLPDMAIALPKRRWRVRQWLKRHSPDVILICDGGVELATHRMLLVAESQVFQAILRYNASSRVRIDQDYSTMKLLLHFFCRGCLPYLGPEVDITTLLSAADMYQLDRLLAALHQCLLERVTPLTSSTIATLATLYHCPQLARIASETQAVPNSIPDYAHLQSLLDVHHSLTSKLKSLSIEHAEIQRQLRTVRTQLKHLFNVTF